MEVKILPLGPIQTNAYFLAKDGHAVLIDAPMGAHDAVTALLEEKGLTLDALLLTHAHWDHTTDAYLFQKDGIPLYGHRDDQELYENPRTMSSYGLPGVPMEPVQIDHWVDEGSQLEFLGESVEVRHVPGHCPGNILFYFEDEAACFSGDVIFAGSVGRADLPGGDFAVLEKSIQKRVFTLPDDTEIYPGHGPITSVREEKRRNPFVRAIS
ncbi:MBL fold metallo-hydrolase [Puniceicoccus vermicola]|uniref:MBL fold metallo-hydrolase n=1 Tax=Puniceicoccus vermicola TaxID=388746 RepID=A0A7X1AUK6_9BACT|nr:MBL fold metallo-hydrolase [Puniceicoccus vermicola]MBC2600295.1 MBL fold metallo-hydrolase [Puniceicoccus vermicola]